MFVIVHGSSALFCVIFYKATFDTALAETDQTLLTVTHKEVNTSMLASKTCDSIDLLMCQTADLETHNSSLGQEPTSTVVILNAELSAPTGLSGSSTNPVTERSNPVIDPLNAFNQRITAMVFDFNLIVYPIIGTLGMIANIISVIVLVHSGLNKPSNIFLLVLAVADSIALLGAINIPHIMAHVPKYFGFGYKGWLYSPESSFIYFTFSATFACLYAYGLYVSAIICTFITLERIVAVYLPLHFTNIVTPTRAWLACCGAFLFWLPYLVYTGMRWYAFAYIRPVYGVILYFSQYRKRDSMNFTLDLYFGNIFGKFIPLGIVLGGSILISIKVAMTLRKRQQMVAASSKVATSGSRTTTTLLLVCFTFTVTKIINLPSYFIDYNDGYQQAVGNLYGIFLVLCEYLNSSCNFFIYVLFNKKFRLVLFGLLSRKKKSR